ncbi:MAG: ABC transporter permease subunit [Gammaproteobacteria bacterium]|nr:ABC transporter permease subunit [Gammaproteobacteria bacterium]
MNRFPAWHDWHIPFLGPVRVLWRDYRRDGFGVAGLCLFLVLATVALFAPWLVPYDPMAQMPHTLLLPPYWMDGGVATHVLGTDDLGRDLLSRLMTGARLSLGLGLVIVLAALVLGVLLGALAALAKGTLEALAVRLMDVLLAVPSLLLAVIVVAVLGPGLGNAAVAIAAVLVPAFMRVTRAAIHEEMAKDYVTAAHLDGANKLRLLTRSVLPNIVPSLVVQTTHALSTAILDVAALGFLGLGAQSPTPEWGTILSESRAYIQQAPWTVTLPGLAILAAVLSINLIGNGLRNALDPRWKR